MRKTVYIALLLLSIHFLTACEKKISVDVLTGTNECQLPCWRNIRPGETDIASARPLLEEIAINGKATITPLEDGLLWFRLADNESITVHTDSNGLINILEFDYRPSSIKLEEVVQNFGDPDYYETGKFRDSYFDILLYYPEKGLAFVAGGKRENNVLPITPEMIVFKGVYFAPTDIDNMNELLYGNNIDRDVQKKIKPWAGYGTY